MLTMVLIISVMTIDPVASSAYTVDDDQLLTCTVTNLREAATISWDTDTAGVSFAPGSEYTPGAFDNGEQESVLTVSTAKIGALNTASSNSAHAINCKIAVGDPVKEYSETATLNVYIPGRSL